MMQVSGEEKPEAEGAATCPDASADKMKTQEPPAESETAAPAGGEVEPPQTKAAEDDLDIDFCATETEEAEKGPEPCEDNPERRIACASPAGNPRVFLSYVALKQMLMHARSDTSREIGGVLVGRIFPSRHGLCTQVTGALSAASTEAGLAHVTFSHDTWTDLYRRLDEQGDDAKIVGWYHSHPGLGIFLSGQDMFIQRNFFTAPGQIAIVVDPVANRWGQFRWREEDVRPSGGFWVYADEEEQVLAAQQLVASLAYVLTGDREETVLEKVVRPFAHLADSVTGALSRRKKCEESKEDQA